MTGTVATVDEIDIVFDPWRWDYAEQHRAEIAASFAAKQRQKPALWNGRTLLVRDVALENRRISGRCFETDYASFLHWRDNGFADPRVKNCFSMAALQARDGAFLLGVMGAHTANAGQAYFVAGMLEPGDLLAGRPDFAASLRRELAEETGLGPTDVTAEGGWTAVFAGGRLGLAKRMRAREDAEPLRERIRRHIASETEPELADMRIVRRRADLDNRVPEHVVLFLQHLWGEPNAPAPP